MPLKLKKSELDAALSLINNHKKRKEYLGYGKKMNLKIYTLCSRDPVNGSNFKTTTRGRLTNTQQLLNHLNRSVLRHDWEAVATCIDFLLNLNGKLLPVIWKAMILVLFNHKKSTPEKLKDFIQLCLGIRTEDGQVKLLEELLSLPVDLSAYNKKKNKEEEDIAVFNWDYSTEEEEILV